MTDSCMNIWLCSVGFNAPPHATSSSHAFCRLTCCTGTIEHLLSSVLYRQITVRTGIHGAVSDGWNRSDWIKWECRGSEWTACQLCFHASCNMLCIRANEMLLCVLCFLCLIKIENQTYLTAIFKLFFYTSACRSQHFYGQISISDLTVYECLNLKGQQVTVRLL